MPAVHVLEPVRKDCCSDTETLTSFTRNHYFYGKLLDVHQLEMEQGYLNRKRWLMNRLGLGVGVLCGLEATVGDDGSVALSPGVAIDGLGRELVVPEAYVIDDPFALTDDCGAPTGEDAKRESTIYVCFHECGVEPAPVLVSDCDVREECRLGATRERYRVLVRDGLPSFEPLPCHRRVTTPPGGMTHGTVETTDTTVLSERPRYSFARYGPALGTSTTGTAGFNGGEAALRQALCVMLERDCAPPAELCVPVAIVFPGTPPVANSCLGRTTIPSNTQLLGLITCLLLELENLGALGKAQVVDYVGGDAQTAPPGQFVESPVAVRVVDEAGNPMPDVTVTFRSRGGGGMVGTTAAPGAEYTATTDANGDAQASWQLGAAGLNTLEAAVPMGSRVVFHALAQGG